MLKQLTKKQKAVFLFIREKIESRGYGPTVREIAQKFDIQSPNGVMCHLRALEKKGLIIREPNRSRAIQISSEYKASEAGLPLRGEVSAGVMNEAIEQTERVDFAGMFGKKSQYALRVKGDSMVEAQISDGDYVVVTKQRTAQYVQCQP